MSHDDDELIAALKAIKELFDRAENGIKQVEDRIDDLVIPGINQLRYAANHMLRAITEPPGAERQHLLVQAEDHCKRALYDGAEPGVLLCLEEIKQFQRDYRLVVLGSTVPNYNEFVSKAREARKLLQETRSDGKAAIAETCSKLFNELADVVDQLDDARPELSKKRRNTILRASAVVIGILIGALGLAFSWFSPPPSSPIIAPPPLTAPAPQPVR